MSEQLVKRLRKYGHVEAADALESAQAEIARLTAALELMPDEIEIFRLMKRGGRNRADQCRVVTARIESIRSAALKGNQP